VALTALTGPDAAHLAHVQRQTTGAVGLALAAEGVVHIAQHIGQRELRVALQECGHLSLVLFRREGAGGVDQFAARREGRSGAVEDVRAQLCALLHQRFAVLGQRGRLFAEHPLTGAGRVHQNPVEELQQGRCDAGRGFVEHDGVGHTHPLKVALQALCTGRDIFVAHQQALPLQSGGELAALAAGGST